jgi:hypothetical protein
LREVWRPEGFAATSAAIRRLSSPQMTDVVAAIAMAP